MNDNIEYEKFTQEIYNEILKNLYVKNIDVKPLVSTKNFLVTSRLKIK